METGALPGAELALAGAAALVLAIGAYVASEAGCSTVSSCLAVAGGACGLAAAWCAFAPSL